MLHDAAPSYKDNADQARLKKVSHEDQKNLGTYKHPKYYSLTLTLNG